MLWFKNTSAIQLTNQNHAGKNTNFNHCLRYVRLKKIFHCMLKKIDQVETSNQWVNNTPGAWSENKDAILLIVGLNKVFFQCNLWSTNLTPLRDWCIDLSHLNRHLIRFQYSKILTANNSLTFSLTESWFILLNSNSCSLNIYTKSVFYLRVQKFPFIDFFTNGTYLVQYLW